MPCPYSHFAVFPSKLPEICIKAGSRKGDLVLDPFFGSGTTGCVAQALERRWIGIELNESYIEIANQKLASQNAYKGDNINPKQTLLDFGKDECQ